MSQTQATLTQDQVSRAFTDRSRIETYQRCKRLRWLEYHEEGMGITGVKKPLPLCVGASVHVGLAKLLELTMGIPLDELSFELAELKAVQAALEDFAQFQAALDIGEESHEMSAAIEASLKTTEGNAELAARVQEVAAKGRSDFEQYLFDEQSALVEGLVRAYARRRLRPLLEQYEVLEVEREGSWLLSKWKHEDIKPGPKTILAGIPGETSILTLEEMELWFMSRPDALLLERESKQLYILSFKTAAKWDRRKAEDAKRDMQGLSEGVEVEKRLADWWLIVQDHQKQFKETGGPTTTNHDSGLTPAIWSYLKSQPAPPQILGIRYEYMLKGERRLDKDLSARIGIDVRAQSSPLVRAYKNQGMVAGDEQWNVSWEYIKETGEASKLYWKTWRGSPVFETITTKEWIDKLDATVMAQGEEGRELGFSSPAQASGYLESHPLDDLFIPPIIIFRNDDDLRDWVEQTEAQEREVVEHVAEVRAAKDEGERRHLLNVRFPLTRRACSYPTDCEMIPICFGGAEIRRDPLATKLYKIREANHPQEVAP